MAFEFPSNTKCAAIHLTNCSCTGLPDTLTLNNELSVYTLPVMPLTELDKARIGKDYADAFERSNLVLVASRLSATAGVLELGLGERPRHLTRRRPPQSLAGSRIESALPDASMES